MSVLISSVWLIAVLAGDPEPKIQILDKFSDVQTCRAIIEAVKRQEAKEPNEESVSGRLQCVSVVYRYTPDGDGPSKAPIVSEEPVSETVQKPCRNPQTKVVVVCKKA